MRLKEEYWVNVIWDRMNILFVKFNLLVILNLLEELTILESSLVKNIVHVE